MHNESAENFIAMAEEAASISFEIPYLIGIYEK